MEYNFNGHYPFQWPNSYLPNGFNSGANAHLPHAGSALQPPHPPQVAQSGPAPAPAPLVYPITPVTLNNVLCNSLPIHGRFSGVLGGGGGVFPFGLHGSYQTSQPNSSHHGPQFPGNWNYRFGNNIPHFNSITPSQASIVTDGNNTVAPSITTLTPVNNADSCENSAPNFLSSKDTVIKIEDGKVLSKDVNLTDELLALKVSSLLSENSSILKNAITKSLENRKSDHEIDVKTIDEQTSENKEEKTLVSEHGSRALQTNTAHDISCSDINDTTFDEMNMSVIQSGNVR